MHPRHTKLLDLICQNGRMAVTELSAALGVSEVTIRKDLNMLAHQGLLKREHGYACMVSSDDIGHHLSFHYENKRRIAERAVREYRRHMHELGKRIDDCHLDDGK